MVGICRQAIILIFVKITRISGTEQRHNEKQCWPAGGGKALWQHLGFLAILDHTLIKDRHAHLVVVLNDHQIRYHQIIRSSDQISSDHHNHYHSMITGVVDVSSMTSQSISTLASSTVSHSRWGTVTFTDSHFWSHTGIFACHRDVENRDI